MSEVLLYSRGEYAPEIDFGAVFIASSASAVVFMVYHTIQGVHVSVLQRGIQGYLAHKKPRSRRTLQ